jgi:hypothetical protein
MASKSQKTEKVRARKARANKTNTKTTQKRLRSNLEVLEKVSVPQE